MFSLNENSGAVTALATIVIAAFTVVLWVATSQQAQLTEKQLRSPGTSLKAMPHVATVLRWLPEHPEFRDQYMLAREQQAEHRADEIVEMADSILPRDGRPADHAEVQAMRLAIDTR